VSIYKPWGAINNKHPSVSLWQRCMHDFTPILRGLRTNSHANEDKYHHRFRLQPSSGTNSWIGSMRLATKRLRGQVRESGASPKNISTNYKFLDEDANPRFAPSTIAQWFALPTAGLAGWIDAASQEHITLRRHHDLVPMSDQHSTSSRTYSPALEVGGLPQEPAQARASTPAQADAISQRQLRGAPAVAAARAKVSAAILTRPRPQPPQRRQGRRRQRQRRQPQQQRRR
jgi:hypothetical protein